MKTFLYEDHLKLQAKMVDFAGFEMPIHYSSIVNEHEQVRTSVGIFDISHMGLFQVRDKELLDFLSTNHLPKEAGTSAYTTFCTEDGGCLDDLIIYKWNDEKYWVVGNAASRAKDFNALVGSEFLSLEYGILAVQGPLSSEILKVDFQKNHFIERDGIVIAATGYTGEIGFECIGPFEKLRKLYLDFLSRGVVPCGLGCRDSLRLEMGYALYGNELTEQLSPLESVSKWAVKSDKEFFGKKECFERAFKMPYGIKLLEKGVPRKNYPIFQNNDLIGIVTSGSFSPTLQEGIALILVERPLKAESKVFVEIRDRRVPAVVTTLPFYKKA